MTGPAPFAAAAIAIHVVSAVVWVGGMFFALVLLRPATGPLEAGTRLQLWSRVLGRFFPWVWAAILLLILSGYGMVFGIYAGFHGIALYINLMQGLGTIMMLLFFHLYFAPWRRFRAAVGNEDYPAAARQLNQIRAIITINLILGLLTVAVGSSGRYWG